MNGQAVRQRLQLDVPISYPWVAVIAYAMVVAVFIADWFTPASVVVDLAYEAPVVFAALKGTRYLTLLTIVLGLTGILLGWFTDLAQASFVLSDQRIENRLLSGVSILIVGSLAIIIQQNAKRTIQEDGDRARRRTVAVSSAVDRVMSALSTGTTIEVIAAEAPRYLEAIAILWCPAKNDGTFWSAFGGEAGAKNVDPAAASGVANLVRRIGARGDVEVVPTAESIGAVLSMPLGSQHALALPIGRGTSRAGVLFAAVGNAPIDPNRLAVAAEFARLASTALQQSDLLRLAAQSRTGVPGGIRSVPADS